MSLVSIFVRPRAVRESGGKKRGFDVTCADIAETYHLLQQINIASESSTIATFTLLQMSTFCAYLFICLC